MNLKLFALSLVAATGIVSGSFLASAPAEAITIGGGSILDLGGRARFSKTTGILDFKTGGASGTYGTPIGNATLVSFSDVFGAEGSSAELKDLTLADNGPNRWKLNDSVSQFISLSNGIKFRLDSFDLALTNSEWLASLTGEFDEGVDSVIGGFGSFDPNKDADFTKNIGSVYSLEVEAVPTPALLPGLIGIGLTALRKRSKSEVEESVEI